MNHPAKHNSWAPNNSTILTQHPLTQSNTKTTYCSLNIQKARIPSNSERSYESSLQYSRLYKYSGIDAPSLLYLLFKESSHFTRHKTHFYISLCSTNYISNEQINRANLDDLSVHISMDRLNYILNSYNDMCIIYVCLYVLVNKTWLYL